MAWKGWQSEVLECITDYSRNTGKLHFSVSDIHKRFGAKLEERAPSRDHIDTTIRGSIRSACRQLAKKGRIVKVGDRGTHYQLPGPPPVERFDLPESLDQTAKDALAKDLDTSKNPQAGVTLVTLVLLRAVLSLQRRCTLLEQQLDRADSTLRETPDGSDTPQSPPPVDTSATLSGDLSGPAKPEPGVSRLPQFAKSIGVVVRGLFDGFTD